MLIQKQIEIFSHCLYNERGTKCDRSYKGGGVLRKFSVVSLEKNFDKLRKIREENGVAYEINDFYMPNLLDDENWIDKLITTYNNENIPSESTMHGAFFDIMVFSDDERIREVAKFRVNQSMEIAERLGVSGVVFHVNCNPLLDGEAYNRGVIERTAEVYEELLEKYSETNIFLENMFDGGPFILEKISEKLCRYKNYGVCLDVAHGTVTGTPLEVWFERLSSYIKHIHINDCDGKKDLHLPVGRGKLIWSDVFGLMDRYAKEASVLIEVTDPVGQEQSIEYLKANGFWS